MKCKNYYEYRYYDEPNEYVIKSYHSNDAEKMMRHVARDIAFSDCNDEEVTEICYKGELIEYCGWEPNNVMRFRSLETGNIVWQHEFPEWDH